MSDFKLPTPEDREDGLEALAFHRGKWTHVKWSHSQKGWSLGYAMGFIRDFDRAFAPLPQKPPKAGDFYDWKG